MGPPPPKGPGPGTGRPPSGGAAEPKGVSAGHGWTWIAEGFRYFAASPLAWVLVILAFTGISFVLGLVPVVGGLAVTLLAPMLTGGMMLGVRAQDQGAPFEFRHLFAAFPDHAGRLVAVALLYLAGMIVIMILLGILMFIFAGPAMHSAAMQGTSPEAALAQVGPTMLLPLLVAALFLIPLMMAYYFAPALVVLEGLTATQAMRLSFSGCLKNVAPFLVYGLIGMVMFFVAAIPLGLGLLVVGPAFVASVYAAYKDIYRGAGYSATAHLPA
jgi:uncharacterized membrane protein